jgi:hypothetical protein
MNQWFTNTIDKYIYVILWGCFIILLTISILYFREYISLFLIFILYIKLLFVNSKNV